MRTKKMKKLISLIAVFCMLFQLFSVSASAAEVSVVSMSVTENSDSYVVNGIIKTAENIEKATVVAVVFSGAVPVEISSQPVTFTDGTAEIADLTAEIVPDDAYDVKIFIWNGFAAIKPLSSAVSAIETEITATSMANGVILNWDAVDGAKEYAVYRDGEMLGTVTRTTYTDKYFSTVTQVVANEELCKGEHTYYVAVNGAVSPAINAKADIDAFKYVSLEGIKTVPQSSEELNANAYGVTIENNKFNAISKLSEPVEYVWTSKGGGNQKADGQTHYAYYVANAPHGVNHSLDGICFDTENEAMLLSNHLYSESYHRYYDYTSMDMHINTSNISSGSKYTLLIEQKVTDTNEVDVLNTVKFNKGGRLDAVSDVSVLDSEGNLIATSSSNGASYAPVANDDFCTYMYDINKNMAEVSTLTVNGYNGEKDIINDVFVRSFAIVESDKLIREVDNSYGIVMNVTGKANGVVLTWDDVADSYDVYRDGEMIATVSRNSYSDRYFATTAQLVADAEGDYSKEHTYQVKAGDLFSKEISAQADTSLIKYYSVEELASKPQTLAQANAANNGIDIKTQPVMADAEVKSVTVSEAPQEYTFNGNTIKTRFYTEGASSKSTLCFDMANKALGLTNALFLKGYGRCYPQNQPHIAMFDVNIDDATEQNYTYLVEQRVNNSAITSVDTPVNHKGGKDDILGGVTVIDKNGNSTSAEVLDNKTKYVPVNDENFYTYVFDVNRVINQCDAHAAYAGVPANTAFYASTLVDDATGCNNIELRSFGVVRSDMYISSDMELVATNKANGVSLSWDDVADSYDVYRDGEKIATVSENSYDDKFFSTVAELARDTEGNYSKAHTYQVKAGDLTSKVAAAKADTSLLKYYNVADLESKPQSLAQANAISNGIDVKVQVVGGNIQEGEVYNAQVYETPQEFTHNGVTVKTRFYTATGGSMPTLCFDMNNKALALTNCLFLEGYGRCYKQSQSHIAFFNVNIDDAASQDYTYLVEQRVNNTDITSVDTPYNHKGGTDLVKGKVIAIDESGNRSECAVHNVIDPENEENGSGAYAPINDGNFYTYVFDVNRIISQGSGHGFNSNIPANTAFRASALVDDATGCNNVELRSFGVVRSDMYIK